MFFSDDPKEFEPLEKEQLEAMLQIWEEDLRGEAAGAHQPTPLPIFDPEVLNARVGTSAPAGSLGLNSLNRLPAA